MSLFDTVNIPCPGCGDNIDIPIKPVEIAYEMSEWTLDNAPESVLDRAEFLREECECGTGIEVVRVFGGKWCLRVSRDYPIHSRPSRIKFVAEEVAE